VAADSVGTPTLGPTAPPQEVVKSALTCDELGWINAAARGDSMMCSSSVGAEGLCSGAANSWDEADFFCRDVGGRLCTLDELLNDETRATGCSADDDLVWSSTLCGESSFWVAMGSTLNTAETACSPSSEGHTARCCADVFVPSPTPFVSASSCEDLGWSNAESFGSSEVCGESNLGLGGCSGFMSWSEAQEFCANAGARLCSADELKSDEARSTGCSLDRAYLWSSSECGDGSYLTAYGGSFAGTNTVCEEATVATIPARCCADVLTTSPTPQGPVIPTSEVNSYTHTFVYNFPES